MAVKKEKLMSFFNATIDEKPNLQAILTSTPTLNEHALVKEEDESDGKQAILTPALVKEEDSKEDSRYHATVSANRSGNLRQRSSKAKDSYSAAFTPLNSTNNHKEDVNSSDSDDSIANEQVYTNYDTIKAEVKEEIEPVISSVPPPPIVDEPSIALMEPPTSVATSLLTVTHVIQTEVIDAHQVTEETTADFDYLDQEAFSIRPRYFQEKEKCMQCMW
ncbi:hypothetical protein BDF19DRAFT_4557 [Syncephalis fuscata]|nr:hypothetical protein BDF19DRAFT_4557 [Syncephalis fuscata]